MGSKTLHELLRAKLKPHPRGLAKARPIPPPACLKANDHKDDYLIFRAWRYPEAPVQSRTPSCYAPCNQNPLKARTEMLRELHLRLPRCPVNPDKSYKNHAAGKNRETENAIEGISPSITITTPQGCLKYGTETVFFVEILCLLLVMPLSINKYIMDCILVNSLHCAFNCFLVCFILSTLLYSHISA